MKRILSTIVAMSLVTITAVDVTAQTSNQPTKTENMETVKQSKEVVQGFFNAFGKGDFNGVINSFHDNCTITAVRDAERSDTQIYGTYKGKDGAKTFIMNLGNAFDTKAFSVDNVIGEGSVAFANGRFTHIVKSTGKSFSSDWALMCVIKDDKIFEYHFYEDAEEFAKANK